MLTKPMVFIETDQRTTEIPTDDSAVLLLDGPPGRAGARCDRPLRMSVVPLTWPTREPVSADDSSTHRPIGLDSVYRAPGLALLAAVSILEGYKWLGVIPGDRSPLSNLVFGRAGAAVLVALTLIAVALLTRPGSGPPRSAGQRLMLLAAGAVGVATAVFVATDASAASGWLGAADLVLAAIVLGSLVAAERSRRQAEGAGTAGSAFPAPTAVNSRVPQ
jgi:hypothetical protein